VNKERVLFVCTHNSARSQMAEGFLRAKAADRFEVQSAGTEQTSVHPLAIRVMAERGIDISGHTSKTLAGLVERGWDYVVTVCDDADQRCPFVPGAKRLHWAFEDPSRAHGSEEERRVVFRRVRDQIESRLSAWLGERSARLHRSRPWCGVRRESRGL
jgi:arsenate reductase